MHGKYLALALFLGLSCVLSACSSAVQLPAAAQNQIQHTLKEYAYWPDFPITKIEVTGRGKPLYDPVEEIICFNVFFDNTYSTPTTHEITSDVAVRTGNRWDVVRTLDQDTWDRLSCPGTRRDTSPY